MNILITIKRQKSPADKPYNESFVYEGDGNITVATYLDMLNRQNPIKNASDESTSPIAWECSCNEKKCGACAMLINGYPRLACAAFLCDEAKNGKLTLAPLSKFPTITDLHVNRAIMLDMLKDMHIWHDCGKVSDSDEENKLMYRSSKCVMCGCCLEICPNFLGDGDFNGAFAMAAAYKAIKLGGDTEHANVMLKEYKEHFYKGCGQSLACEHVCPFDVPHEDLQSSLNRTKKKK